MKDKRISEKTFVPPSEPAQVPLPKARDVAQTAQKVNTLLRKQGLEGTTYQSAVSLKRDRLTRYGE